VFKKQSWVRLTREAENPEKSIYQPAAVEREGSTAKKKIIIFVSELFCNLLKRKPL
jgi:hypothetical protein